MHRALHDKGGDVVVVNELEGAGVLAAEVGAEIRPNGHGALARAYDQLSRTTRHEEASIVEDAVDLEGDALGGVVGAYDGGGSRLALLDRAQLDGGRGLAVLDGRIPSHPTYLGIISTAGIEKEQKRTGGQTQGLRHGGAPVVRLGDQKRSLVEARGLSGADAVLNERMVVLKVFEELFEAGCISSLD